MNWLNKLSERADRLVNTMDATLQQPVTEALVFKPLHNEGQTVELPNVIRHEQAAETPSPINGQPIRAEEPKRAPVGRLKHA
jgi:hypothetical protein